MLSPLRAIVTQFLFLLLSTAIEGYFFYSQLQFSHKKSIHYSLTLNLLSTLIGWLSFFYVQGVLSRSIKAQLLSFIFFNRFIPNHSALNQIPIELILIAFTAFFATFLIHYQGLKYLEYFNQKDKTQPSSNRKLRRGLSRRSLSRNVPLTETASRSRTILFANACSFSLILILLSLQSL